MIATIYILKSIRTGQYYVGSTSDLKKRLAQHARGHTATTRRLAPMSLVYQQLCRSLEDARQIERKVKAWKRKDFIDRIVSEGRITFRHQ